MSEIVGTGKKLTKEMYFELMKGASEIQKTKALLELIEQKQKVIVLESNILMLKAKLMKENILNAKKENDTAMQEYEKIKEKLEKKLKIELKNCVVDEITYEIKKET